MMEKVTKMFSMLMKVWRTGMKDETVFTEAKTNGLKMVGGEKSRSRTACLGRDTAGISGTAGMFRIIGAAGFVTI